ncbi:Predicted nucleic-acid-binding protein, contains PIN domain [Novosphingobium sp. CF614]|uniref:type II toxin-antitoxin system VapC family toxin n=1 Tax=Novosphingobium sp. CF614 TaxID=1884364 RepID=UPI0008F213BA|nr:type II toxin-antitoxin system VapC family toxin [Novosphingobium sp. CF614]SFG37074.1 Predicted nucleic-acid-binding protein, contains PIN domain [Novosphingobium sp. CF614]
MKITADTNILVRAVTEDDPEQGPMARKMITEAELLAVTLPALCEMCWVLRRSYKFGNNDVAAAIRLLLDADNVALDRLPVEAGLAILDVGGDFADGVIAYEGQWLGGEVFVSFDKKAVGLLEKRGIAAHIPA